jgi:zinc transporter ZupT
MCFFLFCEGGREVLDCRIALWSDVVCILTVLALPPPPSHSHGFPTAYAFCLCGMLCTMLLEKYVEGLQGGGAVISALELGHSHAHAHAHSHAGDQGHGTGGYHAPGFQHGFQHRTHGSTVMRALGGGGAAECAADVEIDVLPGCGERDSPAVRPEPDTDEESPFSALADGGADAAALLPAGAGRGSPANGGGTGSGFDGGGSGFGGGSGSGSVLGGDGNGGGAGLLVPLMLAVLLSFHSLVEGVALGVEETIAETSEVLLAILAHKLFAAFALGTNLVTSRVPRAVRTRTLLVFALTTPAGTLLGMGVGATVSAQTHSFASNAVKAIAAGTFLYVGLVEVVGPEMEKRADRPLKGALLLAGAAGMTVLAIWA